MSVPMHRIFISYHHANDQFYKEELIRLFDNYVFIDASVDTGDIDENLPDQSIRTKIRDDYLGSTSVTILLVGTETKHRKHIDWEIYSSMYDGVKNKKSGILVVNLPTVSQAVRATGDVEKNIISPGGSWNATGSKESLYPNMPKRILDNFEADAIISVVDYSTIKNNPEGFKKLIDNAYKMRTSNKYDLSEPMRRRNG